MIKVARAPSHGPDLVPRGKPRCTVASEKGNMEALHRGLDITLRLDCGRCIAEHCFPLMLPILGSANLEPSLKSGNKRHWVSAQKSCCHNEKHVVQPHSPLPFYLHSSSSALVSPPGHAQPSPGSQGTKLEVLSRKRGPSSEEWKESQNCSP